MCGSLTETHGDTHRRTQTHADAHRRTQMNADKCKANCVQCVGGCNLKTHPDVDVCSRTFGTYYRNNPELFPAQIPHFTFITLIYPAGGTRYKLNCLWAWVEVIISKY